MKKEGKSKFLFNLNVIGLHYEKYRVMMIVAASLVAAAALFFSLYWHFDPNSSGSFIDNAYLTAYLIFFGLSLLVIAMLILNKYHIIKTTLLAILVHVYSFLLVAWGTTVCILDLSIGISPFIYVLVLSAIAGLFVLEPFFYSVIVLISFNIILIFQGQNHYDFFTNEYKIENIVNIFIYIVIIGLTAFRHFDITIREYKAQEKLLALTYNDELTGLLNERSYINAVDELNDNIKDNKIDKFAVILMDVNNLKVTNDAYGHRYGCHLIVRCGHTLPTLFKSSKLFHVGGDEFIAIVLGEDLERFDDLIENFKRTFEYSMIRYEGKDLIFSLAHGYSFYQKGDRYQDVLQRADKEMYLNKKALKEKYGMKSR